MKINIKKLTVLSFILCIMLAASDANAWQIFNKGDKVVKPPEKDKPALGEAPTAPSGQSTMQLKQPSMQMQKGAFGIKPSFRMTVPKSGGFPPNLADERKRAELTQKFWDLYKLSTGILNIISLPEFNNFRGADLKRELSDPLAKPRWLIDSLVMSCEPGSVHVCDNMGKFTSLLMELAEITELNTVVEPCTCTPPSEARYDWVCTGGLVPILPCYRYYVEQRIQPVIGRLKRLIIWADPSAVGYEASAYAPCPLNPDAFNNSDQNDFCEALCMGKVHVIGEPGSGCECVWEIFFSGQVKPIFLGYQEMGRNMVMYLTGSGGPFDGWDPAVSGPPAWTIVE